MNIISLISTEFSSVFSTRKITCKIEEIKQHLNGKTEPRQKKNGRWRQTLTLQSREIPGNDCDYHYTCIIHHNNSFHRLTIVPAKYSAMEGTNLLVHEGNSEMSNHFHQVVYLGYATGANHLPISLLELNPEQDHKNHYYFDPKLKDQYRYATSSATKSVSLIISNDSLFYSFFIYQQNTKSLTTTCYQSFQVIISSSSIKIW